MTKCLECSEGTIARRPVHGKTAPFLNVPDLPIPDGTILPSCDACGCLALSDADWDSLTDVLVPVYERAKADKADWALQKIKGDGAVRRRTVEVLADVSPGYLSRIDRGKKTSGALTSILLLAAHEPKTIQRLRKYWSMATSSTDKQAEQQGDTTPLAASLERDVVLDIPRGVVREHLFSVVLHNGTDLGAATDHVGSTPLAITEKVG